jgi:hypothetical protein
MVQTIQLGCELAAARRGRRLHKVPDIGVSHQSAILRCIGAEMAFETAEASE